MIDRDTGESRGFGFVTFEIADEGAAAVINLDGTVSQILHVFASLPWLVTKLATCVSCRLSTVDVSGCLSPKTSHVLSGVSGCEDIFLNRDVSFPV